METKFVIIYTNEQGVDRTNELLQEGWDITYMCPISAEKLAILLEKEKDEPIHRIEMPHGGLTYPAKGV